MASMTDYILFAVLGLAAGAVFASLAIAIVVTYRGSGVINFAAGTTALFGAYSYGHLRDGAIFVPVPGFAERVELGGAMAMAPALAIAVVLSGFLGLLQFALVFRALRDASPLARAAASIGIAVVLQAAFAMQAGTNALAVGPIFPQSTIEIGGSTVPVDRLWLTGCVCLLAAVLVLLYRATRFGHATQAVAESPTGAVLTGLSPDAIGAANWFVSGMVAGFGGVMIAPIVPVVPLAYAGFIVAGLAAALAARFQSIAIALAVGMLIGIAQSELTFLSSRHDWLPSSGLNESISLVVVLVVLLVRGQALPGRGGVASQFGGLAGKPRRPLLTAAILTPAAAVAFVALDGGYRAGLLISVIFAVIALSFTVITGYAGQPSLAQLSLAGVGAFATSGITTSWGVPFPLAPILAAGVAALIGVVIGLPSLRLRGLSVAVATLALAATLEGLWFRNPEYNGGLSGARVERPDLLGIDLAVGSGGDYPRLAFCLMCLLVLALLAVGVGRLRTSKLGMAMLAVRANERSAAATGVNVARTKVAAFAIASFIAGLGGSLLAYTRSTVAADSYSTFVGLVLLATVFLAGVNSISGALIAGLLAAGGVVYVVVDRTFDLGSWFDIIAGIGLVATVAKEPEGVAGMVQRLLAHRKRSATAPKASGAAGTATTIATYSPRPMDWGACAVRADEVTVRYGGVVAVDGVSVAAYDGRVIGLVGPNGAGKSTLLDALSGLVPASGSVQLRGVEIASLPPHARARRGLARTFQSQDLYDDLTVRENVLSGVLAAGGDASEPEGAVHSALERLALDQLADRRVGDLSQGQRQLVSVARAIVGDPPVVLLDEPAAGLDVHESAWLGERIRQLSDEGTAVLLVEHDMTLVRSICDLVYVLDFGKLIATGSPAKVYADKTVSAAYLGAPAQVPTEVPV